MSRDMGKMSRVHLGSELPVVHHFWFQMYFDPPWFKSLASPYLQQLYINQCVVNIYWWPEWLQTLPAKSSESPIRVLKPLSLVMCLIYATVDLSMKMYWRQTIPSDECLMMEMNKPSIINRNCLIRFSYQWNDDIVPITASLNIPGFNFLSWPQPF